MPVTPEEILVTASEMSQGAREEDQRNAVSRAYYAAFHKCRDLASQIDPDGDYSHSSAHQDVPATPEWQATCISQAPRAFGNSGKSRGDGVAWTLSCARCR